MSSAENKDKATLLCENVTVNGKPANAEVTEPKYEERTLRSSPLYLIIHMIRLSFTYYFSIFGSIISSVSKAILPFA